MECLQKGKSRDRVHAEIKRATMESHGDGFKFLKILSENFDLGFSFSELETLVLNLEDLSGTAQQDCEQIIEKLNKIISSSRLDNEIGERF